ncbi:MAG: CehA/McbA family metallohydrolase [Verrucomicrobia bacterium]|nr:CehA/McbA family metallohydrolase [Verrucomicrobiota bacterium]
MDPRFVPAAAALILCPLPFQAAEVVEIHSGNVSELPAGREADGILGDFVMRNDLVEAVISHNAPQRRANMSTFYGEAGVTPGCLYDLTLRGAGNDQLTIFCPGNQQGPVSWVRVVSRPGEAEAVMETARTAAMGNGLAVRHEYRMRDGEAGLRIISHWTNAFGGPKEVPVRDAWTKFEKEGGTGRYRWAESVDPADHCGYAVAWIQPDKPVDKVLLAPGETFRVERFFAVGTSPAEALGRVAGAVGESEEWRLSVRDEGGQGVGDAVVGFEVGGSRMLAAYPARNGELVIPFLKGTTRATVAAPGRQTVKEVANGAKVTLGAASIVRFAVTDGGGLSIPCKVQFHGIKGTPGPDLGPKIRAHGCVDQWHAESGNFEVRLAPGSYRVVVTRGPEHGHHEQEITLEAGKVVEVKARLVRQVDSSGWIAADFHNHSTPSGDNVCGTPDRIINLAAEHIEFAPTTEHNRIFNWAPVIEKLGLQKFLHTVPGMELTGRGAHINCFPLDAVPHIQDNGAPVWEADPRINAHHLRNHGGWDPHRARWIQINHPDMVENFIDRNLDGHADGGFQLLEGFIDGVETENFSASQILAGKPFVIGDPLSGGSRVQTVREFVWLQLLNQGKRIWGVAVADAHAIHGNGVGGWRTYLPSGTDEPEKISPTEIIRQATSGKMILSSGPFLRVTTPQGETAGATVAVQGGELTLDVEVQCADWYDIDRVQILVNGRQDPALNFTRASHPDLFTRETVRFHQPLKVKLERDAHLIVVAIGEQSTLEKGFGTSDQSKVRPCAYNNPIYVDIDGNGFQPSGDTLGYPLVTGGITVDQAREILEKGGK